MNHVDSHVIQAFKDSDSHEGLVVNPVMKKKINKCKIVVLPTLFEAYWSISVERIEVVLCTYGFMLGICAKLSSCLEQ